jgi:hypothetical protein
VSELKPSSLEVYHVFLASPGDVSDEREAVRRFFEEYNRHTAHPRKFHFEVVDWENYSTAGVGRPQELITDQTLKRYKDSLVLVIGLMGQRFGSPSGTHESGTEEEYEWAYKSHQLSGWPEIKWFFRKIDKFEAPSDPELLDSAVEQWKKVRAFRERLITGRVLFFKEYTTPDDFREKLRLDLSSWLGETARPWAHSSVNNLSNSFSGGNVDLQRVRRLIAGYVQQGAFDPRQTRFKGLETQGGARGRESATRPVCV